MTKHTSTSPTAVDFEAFYDSTYSLFKISAWNYVFDKEKFDAYLVAIHNDEGTWVGNPKDYDWSKLDGVQLIMHNASFDGLVIKRLQQDGIIDPKLDLNNHFCTADMGVYLSAPRTLAGAAKQLLDRDVNKEMRDYMRGRTLEDAAADGRYDDALAYVASDAINCYDLWKKYHMHWPEKEQIVSRLNREAQWRGIYVDVPALEADITKVEQLLFDAESKIPWTFDGEKPLSRKMIALECRKVKIPMPASLAQDDEECAKWEEKYSEKYDWILGIRDWRKINTLLKRLKALRACTDDENIFHYQMKYFGCHPGRFSGGGGKGTGQKFNLLNMYRKPPTFETKKPDGSVEVTKVDLRRKLTARPGHCLLIVDYSQIEAIILLWRAGDTERLKLIKEIGNLYIADAVAKGEKIKKGTDDYQRYKAKRLGLGYQCGGPRFQGMAKSDYGIEYTATEAAMEVKEFRRDNPKIVEFWRSHHMWLGTSASRRDPTHEVVLKSGRVQTYFNPVRRGREYKAQTTLGGNYLKFYGGKLTENEIQAIARDVLIDAWVALDKAGFKVLFTVYDEFVIELPFEGMATRKRIREAIRIITGSSPWLEDCPLSCEWELSNHYKK